jgi:DNA-binding MarR family transcriptional regulator
MTSYIKFPVAILYNYDLSLAERIVLVHLIGLQGKNNAMRHKQSIIAEKIGLARSTVNAAISKLEKLGFISTEKRGADMYYTVVTK